MICAIRKSTTTGQISQRGTSLNSFQKRSFSFLRRKRISRILSLKEFFMPCGSSIIDFLIHELDCPARLILLPLPVHFAAASRVFHQQNDRYNRRRQRPPKSKAKLPDDVRHTDAVAGPFEPAPDVGRRGRAKGPGNSASDPDHAPAWLAAQLLRAHAHAELRAAG